MAGEIQRATAVGQIITIPNTRNAYISVVNYLSINDSCGMESFIEWFSATTARITITLVNSKFGEEDLLAQVTFRATVWDTLNL